MVDARKERYGEKELRALFAGATRVIAARGKGQVVFDLRAGLPPPAELARAVLGPSGNLRAPALRVGKTWLVGFGPAAYAELFD